MAVAVAGVALTATATAATCYFFLKPAYTYTKPRQAAFVLSFDDQNVADWYAARGLFRKYNVKATFFITFPDSLNPVQVRMLHKLAADGHEIASHGYKHVNAISYTKKHGTAAYTRDEIIPAIKAMQEKGFPPATFAYPYGANNRLIDLELKKYFYLLRGDSWEVKGKGIDELNRIFHTYEGARIVNGLGIDHGSGITVEELGEGFARAARNKEAIVIYAHAINNSASEYSISPARLEAIFKAARAHKLVSFSFRDLVL